MEVYLVRHFATKDNVERRYPSGNHSDILPVEQNDIMLRRAAALRDACVQRVIVSPALRTIHTAEIYFPGFLQIEEPAFSELDFGIFAGKTAGEMEDDAQYRCWVEGGCITAPPGGEAPESLFQRAGNAFTRHVKEARADGLERIAIVSHAGPIRAIVNMLFDTDPFSLQIPPGAVLRVIIKDDQRESEMLL
jgi:alpha-ribazole phosphatase